MDDRSILRKPDLRALTGLSDSTVRRLEQASEFPKRIQLAARSVGWRSSEVAAWLANRPNGKLAAPRPKKH